MRPAIGELSLVLLSALGFAVVAAVLIGGSVRWCRVRLSLVRADERAELLGWLAAMPFVLGATGALACLMPSILALVEGRPDHCGHHDGHPHLCVVHLPEHPSPSALLLAAFASAWVLVAVARAARDVAKGAALARELLAAARLEQGARLVPTRVPFAGAIGLLRPAVVWTAGLRASLAPLEREAVLAHERAHAVRRDALKLALVRLGWSAVPAALRQPLLCELSMACEEICDRAAAEAVGDPLVVADAILAARRGRAVPAPGAAVGFAGRATQRRIARLLNPARDAAPVRPSALLLVAALLLALAEPLHHLTETLLGLLSG